MHSTTILLSAVALLASGVTAAPGSPGGPPGAPEAGGAPGAASPEQPGGGASGAGGKKKEKASGGSGISIKLHPDGSGISIKHVKNEKKGAAGGEAETTINARGLGEDFDDGLTIYGRDDMHAYFSRGLEHLLQSRWAEAEAEAEAHAHPDPEAEVYDAYEDFYYF